jgi:long-chain acyl-CoA synthetase
VPLQRLVREAEDTSLTSQVSATAGLDTIPKLLARNADKFADRAANREKEFGIWQSWTWSEVAKEVNALALGLLTLDVKPGDHVAIIGRNRPALYWSMVAVQSIGAVPVPLYQDAVADEMVYVLDHCEARFAIVEDQEQVDKVLEINDRLPKLEQIIYLDGSGLRKYDHTSMHAYKDIQDKGRAGNADLDPILNERLSVQNYDTTCVMLYTSGTTGRPKGVVLSNRSIIEASRSSSEFDSLNAGDSVLAYLPMAWVGDFIFSVGQCYWTGFCVACPESPDTMQADLHEIGPSYFFAPPRYFEGLLTRIMIRMEDAGPNMNRMFAYFMAHAKKVGSKMLDGQPIGILDRIKYKFGDWLVYGPLKSQMGMAKVRVGYTAGEAIGPEIFEFFRSMGINLKQLYGQTEASVYVTVQPDGEVRADTVGVPAPGVEIKIDDSGEVHYRSAGTFVEYYKNPEATASTKDKDGWVATGDAGFFEEGTGHLKIIDRSKDVGKMADGSLFAPKYVENKLKFYPNILESVLFGVGSDKCVAFINIDLGAVGNWAERNNVGYGSYQELAGHPQVLNIIRGHVEEVNASLSQDEMLNGCQIHRFLILHKELDPDDGEMTRTRKVRRRIVDDKYSDLIAALNDGSTEVSTVTEVTYEDGRKGSISATLTIKDAKTFPRRAKAA